MSPEILKKMRDMGLSIDQAVELLEAIANQEPSPGARRQRAYRQRQRITRDVTRDATGDVTDVTEAPLSRPLSPQTPLTPTHSPPDITTRARDGDAFAEFWAAYPNKIGKADARKAFAKALRSIPGPDPPSVILAGVERAKVSRAWVEGFIPHPTTWLNRGSWDDQPAETNPALRNANGQRPHPDHKFDAFRDKLRDVGAAMDVAFQPGRREH